VPNLRGFVRFLIWLVSVVLNFDLEKVWLVVSTRTDMANPRVLPLFSVENGMQFKITMYYLKGYEKRNAVRDRVLGFIPQFD